MKHADVRAWLLTAAPEELRTPPEAVGAHVSGCSACAGALAALTRGLADVGAERAAVGPRMSEDDAVRLGLAGARGGIVAERATVSRPPRPKRPSRRRWTLVPAAALGALAVALLWPDAVPPAPAPVRPAEGPGDPGFAVAVAGDDRVAVFATANPRIHVVWRIDDRNRSEGGR